MMTIHEFRAVERRSYVADRSAVVILLVLLVLAVPSGHAEEQDTIATKNDRAIELSKKGMLGKAIEIWFELLDIAGPEYAFRWVFHKNVGRNFQKLEKNQRAWWHLSKAVDLAPEKEKDKLQKRLDKLELKLISGDYIRIKLVASRFGQFLPVDDELARWYPLPTVFWLKPGRLNIRVRATKEGEGSPQKYLLKPAARSLHVTVPMPSEKGHLVVVCDQPTAEIRLNDKLLGIGRIETQADEGDHTVTVFLRGYITHVAKVGVVSGETEELSVLLKPDESETGGGQKAGSGVKTWELAVFFSSLAVVGAGFGTYYGWAGSELNDQETAHSQWVNTLSVAGSPATEAEKNADWKRRLDKHVVPAEVTSYVLWGLGGAGLALSTVVMIVDGTSSTTSEISETSKVLPILSPAVFSGGGNGIRVQFTF